MNYSVEVQTVSAEAARAIESLMTSSLSLQQQQAIYQSMEQLKESPDALQCSLCLIDSASSDLARHLGLQILEHVIKYRWNHLSLQEKVLIKDSSLRLMSSTGICPPYIAEALCRPVVEVVKREWPQQYPDFLNDMSRLATMGPTQTELVLRVFLRLAEDVATFQTMESTARRREVLLSLIANMEWLFGTLVDTLAMAVPPTEDQLRLCLVCLSTLVCYTEWAAVHHVMARDGRLLAVLLEMLKHDGPATQPAAECLNVLLSRHGNGKLEDRVPVLMVFEPAVVAAMTTAAEVCLQRAASDQALGTLRLLAQACVGAVSQLTFCWGRAGNGARKDKPVAEPDGLAAFGALLLAFCRHPSYSVMVCVLPAWHQLLRHKLASKSPQLLALLPQLYECLARRSVWPPPAVALYESWLQVEFSGGADDEDLGAFRSQLRGDLAETLRLMTAAAPVSTFAMLKQSLAALYEAPATPPDRIKWQTVVFLTENVARRGNPAVLGDEGIAVLAACLQRGPARSTVAATDTCIYDRHLSIVSSLANFLTHRCELTPALLETIFAAICWPQPAGLVNREVLFLRRHGCNTLTGLAARQPAALWAYFSVLRQRVGELLAASGPDEAGGLGLHERASLCEMLVSVHAHGGHYEQSCELLDWLMTPWSDMAVALASTVRSPSAFVSAVGLDRPPPVKTGHDTDEKPQRIRSQLNALLSLLNSIMLRSKLSKLEAQAPGELRRRGFVHPSAPCIGNGVEGGAAIDPRWVRNPCTPHVAAQLPNLFQLVRSLHQLRADGAEAVAADVATSSSCGVHPLCRPALQLPASVRQLLAYGVQPAASATIAPTGRDATPVGGTNTAASSDAGEIDDRSWLDRMQSWLVHVHELAMALLKNAADVMRPDFFSTPRIDEYFAGSVLCRLEQLPDFWVRQQMRSVWRPLLHICPAERRAGFLFPLLADLLSHLVLRLDTRWQQLQSCQAEIKTEHQAGIKSEHPTGIKSEHQEADLEAVITDEQTRQLTAEAVQLLRLLLTVGATGAAKSAAAKSAAAACVPPPASDDVMEEDSGGGGTGTNGGNAPPAVTLGPMGLQALSTPQLATPLVALLFKVIGWGDSGASLKAASLTPIVLRFLNDSTDIDANTACQLLFCVLHGFEIHGHEPSNLAALYTAAGLTYCGLRPRFPEMDQVLLGIPNTTPQSISEMYEKMLTHPQISINDRLKRDVLKKLVKPLIGCSVNQLFRKKVSIRDLLPLIKQKSSSDLANGDPAALTLADLFGES